MTSAPPDRHDSPPFALDPRPDAIPAELSAIPQWVGWRWKFVPEQRKPWTKPPVNPLTGSAASVGNSMTWGTFEAALAAMHRLGLPGIGLVLTPELGIVGGDGDACVDPATGEPDPDARAVLTEAATYAEISPSGTGFRFFAYGALPDRIGNGTRRGRYEFYRAARFLTVTGRRFPFAPATIEERAAALASLADRLFPTRQATERSTLPTASTDSGLSDAETVRKAMSARNGSLFAALFIAGDTSAYGGDDSRADEALCCMLAFWTRDAAQVDRLFRRSALYRSKWERADYRERTIRRALELVTEQYTLPGGPRTVCAARGRAARRVRSVEIVGGKAVQR